MTALLGYGRLTDPWSTSGIPPQYRHGLWHAIYLKKGGSLEHLLHENPTYPSGGKGLILHRQSFYGGSAGMYRENYIEFVDDSYHTSQTTAYKADGFGPGYYPEEYFDGWGDIDRNATPITINGAWGTGPLYHPSDDGLGELRWTIFKEANKFYWPEYLDVVGAEAPWHNMTEPAKKAWLPKGSLENYQKGFLYYAPAQAQVEVVAFNKNVGMCQPALQDIEVEMWSSWNLSGRVGNGNTVSKYATNNPNFGQAGAPELVRGNEGNATKTYWLAGKYRYLYSQAVDVGSNEVTQVPIQYKEYYPDGVEGLTDWIDYEIPGSPTSDQVATASCNANTITLWGGGPSLENVGIPISTGIVINRHASSLHPANSQFNLDGHLWEEYGTSEVDEAQIWRVIDSEGAQVDLSQTFSWAEALTISVKRDVGNFDPLSDKYSALDGQKLVRITDSAPEDSTATYSNQSDGILVVATLDQFTAEVTFHIEDGDETYDFSYQTTGADAYLYGASIAVDTWPFTSNITSGEAIIDGEYPVSFGINQESSTKHINTQCTDAEGPYCGTAVESMFYQEGADAEGACAGFSPLDYISLVDEYQGIPEGTKVPIKTLQQLQKVAFEDKANQHSDSCCFLHVKAQSSIDVLSRKDGETKFEFFTKEGHNAIGASEIPGVTPTDRAYAVTGQVRTDGLFIWPSHVDSGYSNISTPLGDSDLDVKLTFSESVSQIKIGDNIFDFLSHDDMKVWKVGTNLDEKPVGQDWHSPRLENTFEIPAHTPNLFTRVEEDTEDIYDGISTKLYDPDGDFEIAGSQNCVDDNSKFPTLCCVFERGDNVYFITITFQGEIPAITTDLNYFGSHVLGNSPINRANEYGSQGGGVYRQWLEPVYLVKDE